MFYKRIFALPVCSGDCAFAAWRPTGNTVSDSRYLLPLALEGKTVLDLPVTARIHLHVDPMLMSGVGIAVRKRVESSQTLAKASIIIDGT